MIGSEINGTGTREMTVERWAQLSPCGRHRLVLGRSWGAGARVAFVGLNPSSADASTDDATLRRCVGFARAWGFDGVLIANLFTLRATDPRQLIAAADRLAPGADAALRDTAAEVALVIEAWGAHPLAATRAPHVQALLSRVGTPRAVLGRTRSGAPRHPLYVPAAARPELLCGRGA